MPYIEAQAYQSYETPTVVDYGSLVDLTAANGLADAEDGLGKILHTDGTSNSL
jgi:hypothetical protein